MRQRKRPAGTPTLHRRVEHQSRYRLRFKQPSYSDIWCEWTRVVHIRCWRLRRGTIQVPQVNIPHALLILHVLTIFYFFFVQQRRCGWWPRLHLCGRFGQQSHTNLPSWWKLLACFRLMGCRWCRIQGTWRCCYYVQWQHSGLRSWKSSRPGLLSKHIMIFRLFVSLFPKWCESLRIIAFRERFIFHFFHFIHKTTHS